MIQLYNLPLFPEALKSRFVPECSQKEAIGHMKALIDKCHLSKLAWFYDYFQYKQNHIAYYNYTSWVWYKNLIIILRCTIVVLQLHFYCCLKKFDSKKNLLKKFNAELCQYIKFLYRLLTNQVSVFIYCILFFFV